MSYVRKITAGGVTKDVKDSEALEASSVYPAYEKKTYSVGDKCTYNGRVKRCKVEISTPEDYTEIHWEDAPIGSGLVEPSALQDAVDEWLEDHPEATTTVQDGSITKQKLDQNLQQTVDDVSDLKSIVSTFSYVPENLNLFNRADSNNKDGYSIGSDGAEIQSASTANYTLSDYIDITGCEQLSWRAFGSNLMYTRGWFYAADKTPISGITITADAEYYQNLAVPSNAVYFRFSFLTTAQDVIVFNSAIAPQSEQRYVEYIGKYFGIKSNAPYVLEVSPYGDKQFKTINEAYARAYQIQSHDHPVTILLYPGTYNEVLETTSVGGVYEWGAFISFVGVNKKDVIWRNDSGLYANSPLHTSNPCLIKGITFIATHDDNPTFEATYASYTEPSQQNYGSYGLHLDDSSNSTAFESPAFETIVEDCVIISKQHAAIGIGLRANQTIIIRNTYFLMDIPVALINAIDSKKGAFLFHRIMADGTFVQHMVLDHNTVETNMEKALYTYSDGGGITVDAFNNMFWSDTNGTSSVITGPTTMFSAKSFGNNLASLNKST